MWFDCYDCDARLRCQILQNCLQFAIRQVVLPHLFKPLIQPLQVLNAKVGALWQCFDNGEGCPLWVCNAVQPIELYEGLLPPRRRETVAAPLHQIRRGKVKQRVWAVIPLEHLSIVQVCKNDISQPLGDFVDALYEGAEPVRHGCAGGVAEAPVARISRRNVVNKPAL